MGVGEGQAARVALLEGDPALGVEADPRRGPGDALGGGVDAADPGPGELTGEEERAVAVAAFDLQHPFGLLGAGVQHRRRQGDHRIGRDHGPIIAGPGADPLGSPGDGGKHHGGSPDRRWMILVGFAVVAAVVVGAILIGRSGGDDGGLDDGRRRGLQAGSRAEAEAGQLREARSRR